MLNVLPFLTWLSAITSGVLLCVSWRFGDLRLGSGLVLLAWLLAAAYFQFCSAKPLVSAFGLLLQTILAVGLLIRWKLNS